jgi:hypothetical protein
MALSHGKLNNGFGNSQLVYVGFRGRQIILKVDSLTLYRVTFYPQDKPLALRILTPTLPYYGSGHEIFKEKLGQPRLIPDNFLSWNQATTPLNSWVSRCALQVWQNNNQVCHDK